MTPYIKMPMRLICKHVGLIVCCLLLPAFAAQATGTPSHSYPALSVNAPEEVHDGTAFACTITGKNIQAVTVTFLGKSITANAEHSGTDATPGTMKVAVLLPVPLEHPKGSEQLFWDVVMSDGSLQKGSSPITVHNRQYPVQKLSVAPKYVTPAPELAKRIADERERMNEVLNFRSEKRYWPVPGEEPMLRPVVGKVTSLFGLRRVLNEQPRGRHRGVDFRGAEGTPIKAVTDGIVVLTGDFYYSGMFVVVDHGLGVLTTSMHMSEIIAVQGQKVRAGQTIGLVGSTGRSTGPHLHLGLTVLGEGVDALPLLAMTAEDSALYTPKVDTKKKNESKTAQKPEKKHRVKTPPINAMNQKVKFEKQMERLQKIVEDLEKSDLSLEKNVALYKEGQTLAASCREQIEKARCAVTLRDESGLTAFPEMDSDTTEENTI